MEPRARAASQAPAESGVDKPVGFHDAVAWAERPVLDVRWTNAGS